MPTATAAPEIPSMAAGLAEVGAALLLVVGLIVAIAFVMRRVQGGARWNTGALRVCDGLQVGPRERVLLIEAAGKYLVVGVGPSHLSTLHAFDAPPPLAANATATPRFVDALKKALKGQGTP